MKFIRNWKLEIRNYMPKPCPLIPKTYSGLTMIEMMMAMGIFTLMLVVILAIFAQSIKVQRRITQIQEELSDARFVVDTMARELRLGTLKYDGTCAINSNIKNCLYYISADGTTGFFKKGENAQDCGVFSPPCIIWSPDTNSNPGTPITTKNITIKDLYFLVTPSQNPFIKKDDGTYDADVQPTVTIHLSGEYTFATEVYPLEFQTTVTTRQYLR